MAIVADYKGMSIEISDLDRENLDYFFHCANHDFRLQRCCRCNLLRYPPSTACPWCANADAEWVSVEGRGEVHSYTEIVHATQPGFRDNAPYLVLMVDLDEQKGRPGPYEALRVVGNLTDADGALLSGEATSGIGIGSRVRMTFTDVAPGLSLPQWTIDPADKQPDQPWRYPDK